MTYVSDDRNYTDNRQSGVDAPVERVGDIRGEPPVNETTDRNKASKMANLLEGLQTTKEEIKDHINRKSPSMGNRINDVMEAVQNNLREDIQYNSVYDIETAAKLVKKND
ncbi:MAG: hypothetical protein K0S67_213 [Nitrososphaeraceae archaeon]|nr:hypothetical protein [Nitrososphaeraceae archaeon]